MISDEEVRQLFQKKLDVPDVVTGVIRMRGQNTGYQFGRNISVQLERGMPAHLWKDSHAAGCFRHFAVFNMFRVIPKYCFDCYKVLVAPRTVVELFKLLTADEKLILPQNNTRKYMVEVRDYCSGAYKGFFYCRGLEKVKEVCRIVREAVSDNISPEVSVTLKRGCSEYAQVYPEYARIDPNTENLKYGKDWQFYEDFADENIVFGKIDVPDAGGKTTNPMGEIFAMQYWLRYAATIGDESYLAHTGGKTLEPIPQLNRPRFEGVKISV